MPNRNFRRNDCGLGQKIRQTVQGDAEQAQKQQQLDQLDQLNQLFRDLEVTANLDPSNSLPSRAPRQHNTSHELSPRQTAQLVPVNPLIQSRNDGWNSFDPSKSPAPPQIPAIDRPCPIPRTNQNPSRTTLAHGSPRLGLGARSLTLERVQQLPITPIRPTSPTLDRIHELRRAENGIKTKVSTEPPCRSDRAQAVPLCGRNIRAEWMKTNSSTESSKTAPLDPSAASFAPTSRRQTDSESILHLPLENDVAEDELW